MYAHTKWSICDISFYIIAEFVMICCALNWNGARCLHLSIRFYLYLRFFVHPLDFYKLYLIQIWQYQQHFIVYGFYSRYGFRRGDSYSSRIRGTANWSFVFDPAGRLCYYWSMVVSLAFLYNFWVIIYRFAFQEINRK